MEEIASMTFEGSAGGGMVKVVASGDMKFRQLRLIQMLSTQKMSKCFRAMVCAAVNEALRALAIKQRAYNAATGGMNVLWLNVVVGLFLCIQLRLVQKLLTN